MRGDFEHGGDLMKGAKGSFKLHPNLIVVRAWWIDECHLFSSNEIDPKTNKVYVNDMIAVHMNDIFMNDVWANETERNNMIDIKAPVTLPIYDHFIVSSTCEHIKGVIKDYEIDFEKEELVLIIDRKESGPWNYFVQADINVKQMRMLQLTEHHQHIKDSRDSKSRPEHDRKLLLFDWGTESFTPSWSHTLSDEIKKAASVEYRGKTLATCSAGMDAYFTVGLGFILRYDVCACFPCGLEQIAGYLTLGAGANAYLNCVFGSDSDDEQISVSIAHKRIETKTFYVSLGPITISATPFLDLDVVITRPALHITYDASASASASFRFEVGWQSGRGAYADFTPEWDFDYDVSGLEYTGDTDRIEAGLAFVTTPGIAFGLFSIDLVEIGLPLSIPHMTTTLVKNSEVLDGVCGDAGVEMKVDFDFEINVRFAISEIEIIGITIYSGTSWQPPDPLFELHLGELKLFEFCFGDTYGLHNSIIWDEYEQYRSSGSNPFMLVTTTTAGVATDWEGANAYCSNYFRSQAATMNDEISQTYMWEAIGNLTARGVYPGTAWIGLNDRNKEGVYKWANDDTSKLEYSNWAPNEPSDGDTSQNCVLHGSTYWENVDCETEDIYAFFCDLEHEWILLGSYRGVYSEYYHLTWEEANDYCASKWGTELASVSNEYQAILLYYANWDYPGWIGLRSKIINDSVVWQWTDGEAYNFTYWLDDDDSTVTLIGDALGINYTFNQVAEEDKGRVCVYMETFAPYSHWTQQSWNQGLCNETKLNAFVCNEHNMYLKLDVDYEKYVAYGASSTVLTYYEASDVCEKQHDSVLAGIYSQETNDLIYGVIEANAHKFPKELNYWIGLARFRDSVTDPWGEWTWEDGIGDGTYFLDYSNWAPGYPLDNLISIEGCTYMVDDGEWEEYDCSQYQGGLVCNGPYLDFDVNTYYGFAAVYAENDSLTWNEANQHCEDRFGTQLAVIRRSEDNVDAYRSVKDFGENDAWIGLKVRKKNSELKYKWADGSTDDYTNWINDNDLTVDYFTNENEYSRVCAHFGEMDFGNTTWGYRKCNSNDTTLKAFVCDLNNEYDMFWSENDRYVFVTVSLYDVSWFEANDFCEAILGTALASMHSQNDTDELMELIETKTVNLTNVFGSFYTWIGLNDIERENHYEWADGSDVDWDKISWRNGSPFSGDMWDCAFLQADEHESFTGMRDATCTTRYSGFACNAPEWVSIETNQSVDYMGVYGKLYSWNWDEANEYCQENYGTQLATIRSEIDNINAHSTLQIMGAQQGWFGVRFTPELGYQSNYSGWSNDSAYNSSNKLDICGYYVDIESDANWDYSVCNETTFRAFVCDLEIYDVFYCKCGDYSNYYNPNDTYAGINVNRFAGVAVLGYDANWDESNDYCNKEFETELASIHSQLDTDIITKMIENNMNNITIATGGTIDFNIWIGLKLNMNDIDSLFENTSWVDRSEINYTGSWEWDIGNDSSSSDDKYCVSVNAVTGKWIISSCDSRYSVFICNVAVNGTSNTEDENDDILDDIWKFMQENAIVTLIIVGIIVVIVFCLCYCCIRKCGGSSKSNGSARSTRNAPSRMRAGTDSRAEQVEIPAMRTTGNQDGGNSTWL